MSSIDIDFLDTDCDDLFLKQDKNDDSEDGINEIDIDKIELDLKTIHNETVFLTDFSDINHSNTDLYNIFLKSPIVVFLSKSKIDLIRTVKKSIFSCFSKKAKFNGCAFINFNLKTELLNFFDKLNKNVLYDTEPKIRVNNEKPFAICFEDGEINKDIVYKRLVVNNKILFFPLSKYKIKLTEYKIRGFCQIMEELGANYIEIEFETFNESVINKDIELRTNISQIAGNLGFKTNTGKSKTNKINYILKYPVSTNMILSENMIIHKIRNKQYIISQDNYNGNLELQYVISSRCRHLIESYTTRFTLDTNVKIDKQVQSEFKRMNISNGVDYNFKNTNTSNFTIKTYVTFIGKDQLKDNLTVSSVSLDEKGFKMLLDSIEDFEGSGIYHIIEFIDKYVNKTLILIKPKKYEKVSYMLKMIRKKFTIDQYSDILKNYFNKNSLWVHFEYFLDLLARRTISYDLLGYLTLTLTKSLELKEKFNSILDFINKKCIEKGIENKFYSFFRPNDPENKLTLMKRLIIDDDIVVSFNEFNLKQLLKNIESYEYSDNIKDIYNNMIIGIKEYEFEHNYIPYIYKKLNILYNQTNDNIYTNELFIWFFRFYYVIDDNLNNDDKINDRIEKIYDRMKEINEFLNNVKELNKDSIVEYMIKNKNDYPYLKKKINSLKKKRTFGEAFRYYMDSRSNTKKAIYHICKYKEKMRVDILPINKTGLLGVKRNIDFGDENDIEIFYRYLENIKIRLLELVGKIDNHELYDRLDEFKIKKIKYDKEITIEQIKYIINNETGVFNYL